MKKQNIVIFLQRNWLILLLISIKLILNLGLAQHYGYFRDEFLYIMMSRRLLEAPMDMPLFAPALLSVVRWLLGESPFALHLFPTLAGAGTIILTNLMVRRLGGKLFAQILAGVCVLLTPVYLGMNSTYSYDSFDKFFWVLTIFALLRILIDENPRGWLFFGLAAGLGLLTKQSMLFLGFAITLALLITPQSRQFKSIWIWAGAGIAFLFFLPYLIMQIFLDWPVLGYFVFYTTAKTYPVSPLEFIKFQIIAVNPLSFPVWLAGLSFLFFAKEAKKLRVLGWTYLILLALFIILKAKFYFLAPFYPILFAAGAITIENLTMKKKLPILRPVYIIILVVTGLFMAPMAVPLLPIETFIKFTQNQQNFKVKAERIREGILPQHYADRFGWENMADQVVKVYQSLPPEDQSKTCIFTGNYGEAGAIEFFGKPYNLPPIISGHGQYYYWGPGKCTGEIVIVVGVREHDLKNAFQIVEQKGLIVNEHAMPYESNLPIFVCRQPKASLKDMWKETAHFD